jgi:hypothetical protein
MLRRNPILALVLAALFPAQASAAEIKLELTPAEARYGASTELSGTVSDDAGKPMPGTQVALVGRRYPYVGPFQPLATGTTDATGAYRFEREFERNWQVKVLLGEESSPVLHAYVFPQFTLSFTARNARVIKLTQRYRVPRGVELDRPTLFYVGRRGSPTAPVAATAKVRRIGSGRFVSNALVRIPAAWDGRFRYASCFRYTRDSGMGRPGATCPKRFRF